MNPVQSAGHSGIRYHCFHLAVLFFSESPSMGKTPAQKENQSNYSVMSVLSNNCCVKLLLVIYTKSESIIQFHVGRC